MPPMILIGIAIGLAIGWITGIIDRQFERQDIAWLTLVTLIIIAGIATYLPLMTYALSYETEGS